MKKLTTIGLTVILICSIWSGYVTYKLTKENAELSKYSDDLYNDNMKLVDMYGRAMLQFRECDQQLMETFHDNERLRFFLRSLKDKE